MAIYETSLTESRAFREALLRSEVRRAYAMIGLIAVAMAAVLPELSIGTTNSGIRITALVAVAALLAVQLNSIAVARWARRRSRDMPIGFAAATVVLESLIPTTVVAAHILRGSLTPYAALSSPPVLAYGLIIGLTTLKLRPALCVLAGTVGAASYIGLVLYVRTGMAMPEPTTGLPRAAYFATPVLVFVMGLAGAWVAHEVRGYMHAAMREAESRRTIDKMEQDLAAATAIQRALVPRESPRLAGYDIAGWNRPADQTGGDYYDWQELPDGNWIVTLADVSGHGIGPAMVTAACRAYMRASTGHYRDLASVTSRVNTLLSQDLPDGRFVTMVGVLLTPDGGPVGLLSAGHGPIVLYVSATGELKDLAPTNLPLAVLEDQQFGPAQPLNLTKGDLLALVTDGFVEWSRRKGDASEQFGLGRLRESLRRHAHRAAPDLIAAVAEDVAAFAAGEPQQDDLTMVVIRRTS